MIVAKSSCLTAASGASGAGTVWCLNQQLGVWSHLLFEHPPNKLPESGFYVFKGQMVGDAQHECRVLKRCGNCALEPYQEAGGVDLLREFSEQGIPHCLRNG